MSLAAILIILLGGGALAWAAERLGNQWPRRVALTAMLIALAIALPLLAGEGWRSDLQMSWITRFGVGFHVAVDGISAPLVVLALVLGIAAAGAGTVNERPGFFQFNLLASLAGVVGVFCALDLFLFFLFWEVMIVPMYFLIVLWGHEGRLRAGAKFFLFTQASGLLMLVAMIALAIVNAPDGGLSFDYFDLQPVRGTAAAWIMTGFFLAFAVKLPMVLLHTWLPDAHTEAPTAASVLLAGILLKTGAYGMLRFVLPLFPESVAAFAPWAMALGAAGVLYGALLAFAQHDAKRLVAYTSVSHMGFVLLAIFAANTVALQGALMQMIAHGLSTGALFLLVGALQERLHTRDMRAMGGMTAHAPRLAALGVFFAMASLGLPGLANFVGEFLALLGAFRVNGAIAVLAALGLVGAAIYALAFVQQIFHGPPLATAMRDLGARDTAVLGAMAVALLWLGLFPSPLLNAAAPALLRLSG